MVYLPLAALFVLVPAAALGHHAKAKKLGYLAACLALALVLNTGTLTGALGSPAADNAAALTEETTDDARSAKNAPAGRTPPTRKPSAPTTRWRTTCGGYTTT